MITLDPKLQIAQDSQVRHPIVKLTSKPFGKDIPFDGQYLTQEVINEYEQDAIVHSSGRICTIYLFGEDENGDWFIKFVNTDLERVNFFNFNFKCTKGIPKYASMTELANLEKTIGIVYLEENIQENKNYLSSAIIAIDDKNIASVSNIRVIDTWNLE